MPRPPIRTPLALALAFSVSLAGILGACTEQTFEGSVSQGDLEGEVEKIFPPENPSASFAVTCEGGIESRVGATQTCRIARADDDSVDSVVRVGVTDIADEQTRISAVPFVPADRVAGIILDSLLADGYLITEVTCEAELEGEVGASTACTAAPATEGNDGGVVATVTRVNGLRVSFDYELSDA